MLRQRVGAALRSVRTKSCLSLDDVEKATGSIGARVTRSHLSRVENGLADIALPRFISLMRALGEAPALVLENLEPVVEAGQMPAGELLVAARRARRAGDLAAAASLWRRVSAIDRLLLDASELDTWAVTEMSLGRFRPAAAVAEHRLDALQRSTPRPLVLAATTLVGAGRLASAQAYARAARAAGLDDAAIVECAALLAWGRAAEAAEACAERRVAGRDAPSEDAARVMAGAAYLACDRARAALRSVEPSTRPGVTTLLRAEALLVAAQAHGRLDRARAGAREAERAIVLARDAAVPELVARAHDVSADLHERIGARTRLREARRAARVLRRRIGADAEAAPLVPIQGLLLLGIEPSASATEIFDASSASDSRRASPSTP
jgi:transcriptional regulator with XRE-family HTH domain